MEAVGMIVSGLLLVCGIGSLVCWIMVLVNIFRDNIGLGILGLICGLFAFIYGWVKVQEYGIKKVMIWWTIFFVGAIVLQVIAAGVGVGMAAVQQGGA